jgi:hypothetical protein
MTLYDVAATAQNILSQPCSGSISCKTMADVLDNHVVAAAGLCVE